VAGDGESPEERLRRDPDDGMVAGVLAGLAVRLGLDPLLVRVLFAVGVVASGGLLLVAYAVAWAILPGAPAASRGDRREGRGEGPEVAPAGRRPRGRLALGAGLLTLAVLLSFRELGIWWSDALAWPLVLAAAGVALLWRQSTADEPQLEPGAPYRATEGAAPPDRRRQRRASLLRLYRGGFGVALVLGAALLFLFANDTLGAARDVAVTAIVVAVAAALILAPFLWRLGRKLAAERAERIRTQEKAELAAHLHDSVLQTLTLMQKRAQDPEEVAALARRQERELRSWLAGEERSGEDRLAGALTAAAEQVEDAHRTAIEVVVVGDCEVDERAAALVGAAREALTNAAKFAAPPVSLYAEVDGDRIEAFVRDRGGGFDPTAVDAGRRGISESIVGRMERNGGSAEINSGEAGTEVQLRIDRDRT
jgi:phage shock protein PspC (stress-responsive transcriptional regulator)/signal transduction histidine kinase